MSSSNLAVRFDPATQDLLREPARPVLQLFTNSAPQLAFARPRLSLAFRSIVIRDQGFRSFRVF